MLTTLNAPYRRGLNTPQSLAFARPHVQPRSSNLNREASIIIVIRKLKSRRRVPCLAVYIANTVSSIIRYQLDAPTESHRSVADHTPVFGTLLQQPSCSVQKRYVLTQLARFDVIRPHLFSVFVSPELLTPHLGYNRFICFGVASPERKIRQTCYC